MEIVRQETGRDCGVCALSMATGYNYAAISSLTKFGNRIGVTSFEMCNALAFLGFEYKYLTTKEGLMAMDGENGASRLGFGQSGVRLTIDDNPAILVTENSSGGFHAVYFDGAFVADPARPDPQFLQNYKILEAIIIGENERGIENFADFVFE